MKFGILVLEGPYNHEASDTAYKFTEAALEAGHQIQGIFFYNDGVNNVTKLMEPPIDDRNIAMRWAKLAEKHSLDLIVCIAAGKRRGITPDLIIPHVRIDGLGQLNEICVEADRMVTFGD
ncbi:MAG: sulfurtransferase complex subunit TusD [Nitrospirae bacterium CG18_big_fil_WC_8_21_14_2_50_70_55]|nr:sulfurtransferase complex subunit TusD [Deltaproteobacteria bacterium]OIP66325.1 MAG: sulfurtransferase TusD [Nitrospirae bacterium CG2_30_70_394]PIQ06498.1 MAG: sulfurtransferase complex subunit TusD [Nitrospirae bacterium CG18_big_fil_WC_8_21_14_2_50_70_55]PIU79428.1 MAG: sulfurtransferase complex subunit TusD [Nitrospirae bacterium CG06_land_8_20_14_3_00_70_43]PIW82271.1 MAG: sulfurtransferase complex subunit TusD [Nitrospirae bacterium CG_4_8_14_3_um_filter_70_85]PIX83576.1 MAG: sulfurt